VRHGHGRHGAGHGKRLSRAQRASTWLVFAIAWSSGALWLLFHYFLQRQGEFGLEPHPLEHWWLRLHGLTAFAALWLGGLLWALHVRDGLRRPQRRASGLAIMSAFVVLAASGYLVYYADEGGARDVAAVLHWSVGLLLAVPLVAHWRGAARAGPPRRFAEQTGLPERT
jgi:hypothetical protein